MISGCSKFRHHRWGGRGGHGRVGLPVGRGGLGTADKCIWTLHFLSRMLHFCCPKAQEWRSPDWRASPPFLLLGTLLAVLSFRTSCLCPPIAFQTYIPPARITSFPPQDWHVMTWNELKSLPSTESSGMSLIQRGFLSSSCVLKTQRGLPKVTETSRENANYTQNCSIDQKPFF